MGTAVSYWAAVVAVGLPVGLILLTELQYVLRRRGSALTRPVSLLRNYVLPLGAVLLLLVKSSDVPTTATGVRIVTTVLGFAVLVMLLSGLSATVFQSAPEGSWRKRMPSIFIEVLRFTLIAVGLGMIFSYVWGAPVGKLFTVLGISSIVLGLTLQNSVGQIISGLLLLFEQPFRLGDWVETSAALRGRVAEVNWRATHIDTGRGLEIIPNSVLAGQAFANLSRPADGYTVTVTSMFSGADAPDQVCRLLSDVAAKLPQLHPDGQPEVTATSATEYETVIPIRSPADDRAARSTFQRWLWYAARRAGLRLGGLDDDFQTSKRLAEALGVVAPTLRLTPEDIDALLADTTLVRYGVNELVQADGEVPAAISFVIKGQVRMVLDAGNGAVVTLRTLRRGDFLGQTALTRQPVIGQAFAVGELTLLQIGRAAMDELVRDRPDLLRDISRAIEERKEAARAAAAGDDPDTDGGTGPDTEPGR